MATKNSPPATPHAQESHFRTESRTSSQRSSASSGQHPPVPSDAPPSPSLAGPPGQPASGESTVTVDVLMRKFPKPSEEFDMDELLARPALRQSLRHWLADWREVKRPVEDKEVKSRAFEQAKKELLQARAEMAKMKTSGSESEGGH